MASPRVILRPFWRSCAIGVVVSSLMAALHATDALSALENLAWDWRFRHANRRLQPVDRIRIVAIDDQTLMQLEPEYGRYPWPRRAFAELIEVLREVGADRIALDLHFREAMRVLQIPVDSSAFDEPVLDDDRRLAEAVAAAGNVYLPVVGDIQADEFKMDEIRLQARRSLERVAAQLQANPNATVDSIRQALGDRIPAAARMNGDEIAWAMDQIHRQRAVEPDLPLLPRAPASHLARMQDPPQLPIVPLAEAAHGFGHVVFERDADGVVRRLPMLVRWNGRIVPQMALRLATDLLHLRWSEATITPESLRVPWRDADGHDRTCVLYIDKAGRTPVNWTGPGETWQSCFSPISAGTVAEVAQLRRAIRRNQSWLQTRQLRMVELIQPTELDRYRRLLEQERAVRRRIEQIPPGTQEKPGRSLQDELEKIRLQAQQIETACIDMLNQEAPHLATAGQPPFSSAAEAEAAEYAALYREIARGELAARVSRINANLAVRIDQRLEQLRKHLEGRIVFVGCTAVALGDIVSTSIWKESPGVMTHAQVLNAILQEAPLAPVRESMNLALVMTCCLLVTFAAARLGPRASLPAMAAACLAFSLLSSLILFERMGIMTSLATPLVGMFVTWSMITAYRQLLEQRGRRHMTRSLEQYTSPALARRMAEDPEAVARAELREISCFFSDLKGFTAISEQLGPRTTQQVLNTYLERMTEALDGREALINKFLGDGVFAFFNPPIHPQADHAERACRAALDAVAALSRLKRDPAGRDCQGLHMRIGLATGTAIVGNCGSRRKFDYTCIGDTVNLASRLEGANKAFGTTILINGECRRQAGDALLCRYLGRVVVAGRSACEEVYELLATAGQVVPPSAERIERFEQAVRCFIAGSLAQAHEGFQECLRHDAGDAAARFYLETCQAQMRTPLPAGWTGAVKLTGK